MNNSLCVPMADMMPLILSAVNSGGRVEMTVTGQSMKPLLLDRRSVVRLEKPERYSVGDIVLFQRENGDYVLHRIVRAYGGVFDILGDNQCAADKGVCPEQVIASVCAFARDGKHWHRDDRTYRRLLPLIRRSRIFALRLYRKLRSYL